jgi:hypothetical protein
VREPQRIIDALGAIGRVVDDEQNFHALYIYEGNEAAALMRISYQYRTASIGYPSSVGRAK